MDIVEIIVGEYKKNNCNLSQTCKSLGIPYWEGRKYKEELDRVKGTKTLAEKIIARRKKGKTSNKIYNESGGRIPRGIIEKAIEDAGLETGSLFTRADRFLAQLKNIPSGMKQMVILWSQLGISLHPKVMWDIYKEEEKFYDPEIRNRIIGWIKKMEVGNDTTRW